MELGGINGTKKKVSAMNGIHVTNVLALAPLRIPVSKAMMKLTLVKSLKRALCKGITKWCCHHRITCNRRGDKSGLKLVNFPPGYDDNLDQVVHPLTLEWVVQHFWVQSMIQPTLANATLWVWGLVHFSSSQQQPRASSSKGAQKTDRRKHCPVLLLYFLCLF